MAGPTHASDFRLQRLQTDMATYATVVATLLVGVGLLWVGSDTSERTSPIARALLLNLGGLVVASAALSLLWQLRLKRNFADEVLAAAGVAADTRRAGLKCIGENYLDVVDWSQLFADASSIDLWVSWGATWRRTREADWHRWIAKDNANLRVLLPDYRDDNLVAHLATRYGKSPEYVVTHITEAAGYYDELAARADGRATVSVRYLARAPVWSFYGMGRTIVTALYPQSLHSEPGVPCMVFESPGVGAAFFTDQFDRCWEEATDVTVTAVSQRAGDPQDR